MRRETIGKILFIAGFIMIAGIVGGVELGSSVWNMLWCIPCAVGVWAGARLAGFMD